MMKTKKVLVLFVAAVMVLSLAACGGSGSDDAASMAGTYNMTTMEAAGVSMDIAQLAEAAGIDADAFKLVLAEDGTFELSVMADTGTETVEGTWKASGSTLTLTAEGEDMSAAVEGSTLTIEETQDGQTVKMVFEKQ